MPISASATLKYSEIRQYYLRFCLARNKNLLSKNSSTIKLMKYRADFGAKDAAMLSPCKDDKPKDAYITQF